MRNIFYCTYKLCFLSTRSNFGTQDVAKVALSIPNQQTRLKTSNYVVDFKFNILMFHYTTHMLLTFLHFTLFVSTYISQFYYNQSQGLLPFAFLQHVCMCVWLYRFYHYYSSASWHYLHSGCSFFRSITKRLYVCSRTRVSL